MIGGAARSEGRPSRTLRGNASAKSSEASHGDWHTASSEKPRGCHKTVPVARAPGAREKRSEPWHPRSRPPRPFHPRWRGSRGEKDGDERPAPP